MSLTGCLICTPVEILGTAVLECAAFERSSKLSERIIGFQTPSLSAEELRQAERDVPFETLLLMAGSAVMACTRGLSNQAEDIAAGLTPHFSKHVFVTLLRAMLALSKGQQTEALQIVEGLMRSSPRSSYLMCTCATLKQQLDLPGWRELAQLVLDRGDDADAVGAAEQLLAKGEAASKRTTATASEAALANLRFA